MRFEAVIPYLTTYLTREDTHKKVAFLMVGPLKGGRGVTPYMQKAVHPSILAAFKNVALQRHFDILQRHFDILQRHIDIWQRHKTSGSVI